MRLPLLLLLLPPLSSPLSLPPLPKLPSPPAFVSPPAFIAASLLSLSLLAPPSLAAGTVAPLADVGLGEFLVKDSKQLLRLSLPYTPGDPGRAAQESLEYVKLRLDQVGFAGKKSVWSSALKDLSAAKASLSSSRPALLEAVPGARRGAAERELALLDEALAQLGDALRDQDISATTAAQAGAAERLYEVRLAAQPRARLPYELPGEVAMLPTLRGRATVSATVTRGDARAKPFEMGESERGQTYSATLPLSIVVDGLRAPVTAGNFVDLVARGAYAGAEVGGTSDLFVNVKAKKPSARRIPLELFYKKDGGPTYHYNSDEDKRATEAFMDPFQAPGAMGMVHEPEDSDSASDEFFFLKWKQNADKLDQIRKGDVISAVKVVDGMENFVPGGK
ncbi:hypothetical protein TeGR_g6687 [Tetraparma gracilis]|uniref:peptidylprolyl isomerase n=1 Tax=Tetraparma gracilis TaxID=2962635 RepID=A0ABQ6M5U9_9STRA|nr:hypothetical protein TeGR_g6687 [Tetraparma gracilis]